jgi:hypothetical protein
VYRQTINELNSNKGNINQSYQKLNKERREILKMIKEFEKLEAVNRDSSLASSTNYTIFLFLLILSLIIVFLLIFLFISSSTNSSSSSSSSSFLQKGGFYNNLFSV